MIDRVFLDSNVLVYADDEDSPDKRDRARALVRETLVSGRGVLSTQVLQEYFVNATRKLGLDAAAARARVDRFLGFEVVTVRLEHILAAIDLHRLRAISFWDALIVRCAADSACERVLTEDLQDGELIDGVRVENPFA